MNVVVEIQRINEAELRAGLTGDRSWHARYRDSAWVYVGGLDTRLSEGDVIAVMSQYGEVEDAHLVRDEATGATRGFAFVKYEDWRSTVLAVDNLTGVELLGRTLRVDHKAGGYEPPKAKRGSEAQLAAEAAAGEGHVRAYAPGAAYAGRARAGGWDLQRGVNLWAPAGAGEEVVEPRGGAEERFEQRSGAEGRFEQRGGAEGRPEQRGGAEGHPEQRSGAESHAEHGERHSHRRHRHHRHHERDSRDAVAGGEEGEARGRAREGGDEEAHGRKRRHDHDYGVGYRPRDAAEVEGGERREHRSRKEEGEGGERREHRRYRGEEGEAGERREPYRSSRDDAERRGAGEEGRRQGEGGSWRGGDNSRY